MQTLTDRVLRPESTWEVTVHSPCRFEPLTLTLDFGILRRSTSSIHGVVSLRERGFEEGGVNGYPGRAGRNTGIR
jgi:hypothetical protein